ncbi:hypothetical protein QBC38DRAFT_508382 [Podospora fimiseda]|uniref:FAD-binding domain-containing protein n=1 Tax=Podospora fimiseda TaxID=252190 RepID=A0AAN7BTN4_9PEZI|nr:hypothetical protein QBC38DRAFT_508382 [Podospora fimiseda]
MSSSPISVIIVGAGFAGLTAALELSRKSIPVLLLEKSPSLSQTLGDIISFGQNSSRFFAKWPGVLEKLDPIIHQSTEFHFHDWQGKFVTTQSFVEEHRKWGTRVNGHRGEIHQILFDQASAQPNISILLNQTVMSYSETKDSAIVTTSSGHTFTADLVLAAEGVHSRARSKILGYDDHSRPTPSGYAVFRAWFPSSPLLTSNPLIKHLVYPNGDTHNGWIGKDVHFLTASIKNGTEFSWVCTHADDAQIKESWQFPGSKEKALKVVEGWDPIVQEIIRVTPEDRLFDYKLVFRDPLPTFVSPEHGRIAVIGDAAHPFLPTSVQGASQAMEDGVVMAACLDIAGKDKVQEAVKVWERIRYERVHAIQKTGVQTREQWHKADWDAIWKNPDSLHLKREAWILDFDAEKVAYQRYQEVRKELESGEKL